MTESDFRISPSTVLDIQRKISITLLGQRIPSEYFGKIEVLMSSFGLKEGDLVKSKIENYRLLVKPVRDPIELAMSSKKWGKTNEGKFVRESQRDQSELYSGRTARISRVGN